MDSLIRATVGKKGDAIKAGHIHPYHPFVQMAPPPNAEEEVEPVTHSGHCVKCKGKKDVETEGVEPLKNGAHRAYGKCPDCGSGVHTFMKSADGKKLSDALKKQTVK